MLCHGMLYCVMLCYVMIWYFMLCYVMLCYVMLCYDICYDMMRFNSLLGPAMVLEVHTNTSHECSLYFKILTYDYARHHDA